LNIAVFTHYILIVDP